MGLTVRHVEAVRKGARVQPRGLSTRDRHPRFTLSDPLLPPLSTLSLFLHMYSPLHVRHPPAPAMPGTILHTRAPQERPHNSLSLNLLMMDGLFLRNFFTYIHFFAYYIIFFLSRYASEI